jgi:hypothetical protein
MVKDTAAVAVAVAVAAVSKDKDRDRVEAAVRDKGKGGNTDNGRRMASMLSMAVNGGLSRGEGRVKAGVVVNRRGLVLRSRSFP